MQIQITEDNSSFIYIDGDVEISGELMKCYDGRKYFFKVEPNWFLDDNSEDYWNDNWEDIEESIIKKIQ